MNITFTCIFFLHQCVDFVHFILSVWHYLNEKGLLLGFPGLSSRPLTFLCNDALKRVGKALGSSGNRGRAPRHLPRLTWITEHAISPCMRLLYLSLSLSPCFFICLLSLFSLLSNPVSSFFPLSSLFFLFPVSSSLSHTPISSFSLSPLRPSFSLFIFCHVSPPFLYRVTSFISFRLTALSLCFVCV